MSVLVKAGMEHRRGLHERAGMVTASHRVCDGTTLNCMYAVAETQVNVSG